MFFLVTLHFLISLPHNHNFFIELWSYFKNSINSFNWYINNSFTFKNKRRKVPVIDNNVNLLTYLTAMINYKTTEIKHRQASKFVCLLLHKKYLDTLSRLASHLVGVRELQKLQRNHYNTANCNQIGTSLNVATDYEPDEACCFESLAE